MVELNSPLSVSNPLLVDEKKVEVSDEQLSIARSQWLPQMLEQYPQILSLRERTLPWTGGYSFANIVSTAMTVSLSPVNRFVILQLIYQHLQAIGMHQTAENLMQETGLKFQSSDQPWQKTDLLILLSLGVLPKEDPWNIPRDPLIQYVEEPFEEDFFASHYREDPKLIYQELINTNTNIVYCKESGRTFDSISSLSLRRLVVLLVTSSPEFLSDENLNGVFLMLHSITSSEHFLEHLIAIFEYNFQNKSSSDQISIVQKEVRVSIVNLIRKWVLFHGLFIGQRTLKKIKKFIQKIITSDSEEFVSNRTFLTNLVFNIMENLTYGISKESEIFITWKLDDSSNKPQPLIKDPQIIFKSSLTFLDPEPLEVARQITLISHSKFKKIHSREFMKALTDKKCSLQTPILAEFLEFSFNFCQMVLETVISSNDRNATFARVIEIANGLEALCNFQLLSDLMSILSRSEILAICHATTAQMRSLQNKCGDSQNVSSYNEYSQTLRKQLEDWQPAIPNFGAEFRAADFAKIPEFVDGLINMEKRRKMADKATLLYRLQNKRYSFTPVQQIQKTVMKGPLLGKEALDEKILKLLRTLK